jgi:tRNA (guanine26-N2/guanine27-N2)-dimethyltransferase
VIDLDPYGTPSMLLDTAVQSVAEGGLLLVTATDMANLCGNNSVACWSNYSSYPLHRSYCHEQALRIILGCIEAHANRCELTGSAHTRASLPVLRVEWRRGSIPG